MVKYRIAFSDKFVLLVILDTDLMMTSDRVIIIHNVVTSDIDTTVTNMSTCSIESRIQTHKQRHELEFSSR